MAMVGTLAFGQQTSSQGNRTSTPEAKRMEALVRLLDSLPRAAGLERLLEDGLDPNLRIGTRPLLHVLAAQGDPDAVKVLLEHGADPDSVSDNGWTALDWATGRGRGGLQCVMPEPARFEETQMVLKSAGAEAGQVDDIRFVDAVARGRSEDALRALAGGSNPFARDGRGKPAILYAAEQAEVELLKALLAAGVSPRTEYQGYGVLIAAVSCPYAHTACARDASRRAEAVALLLASGADPNEGRSKWGGPILMAAGARPENIAVIDSLLSEGSDPSLRNPKGETALIRASVAGNAAIVIRLLRERVDMNIRGRNGYTALLAACRWDHPEVVEELVKAGADQTVRGPDGKRAFDLAGEYSPESLDFLERSNGATKTRRSK